MTPAATRHPTPTGVVEVPIYKGVQPVLTVGAVADYFGVSKQLVAKWTRREDWPAPFAELPPGAIYRTADVIEWGRAHERKRAEGPREAGDPRPPSVQRRRRAA